MKSHGVGLNPGQIYRLKAALEDASVLKDN
jgi:hypothetical protein